MKYAHKFDPGKDELPPFWQKEIFKRPLKRLNTAKMTPLDAAIYKNMLIRVEAAENIVDKQIRQAVEIATKEAIEQANQAAAQAAAQAAEQAAEQAKAAAEQAKLDSIKKLLLRGKATVEEIAEDFDVSIEFVKDVQMSLNTTK